jgi:diadenosine tetraphosphatase ApaH/serine/threonine PP2A family protein phosphatase
LKRAWGYIAGVLIGFLADPHANLPAVETVLADVDRVRPDALVCLGDFVGYGAHPNEVVDALRHRCDLSLVGNHDLAALGKIDLSEFNRQAAQAALWTQEHLSREAGGFLESLTPRASFEGAQLAHASLRDPVWEYVDSPAVAAANFAANDFGIAFVGHTHVPAAYWHKQDQDGVGGGWVSLAADSHAAELSLSHSRLLLNPGGIGQPRDGDPRASWATWDTEASVFTVRRLEYAVAEAQGAITAAGLPGILAERLSKGW